MNKNSTAEQFLKSARNNRDRKHALHKAFTSVLQAHADLTIAANELKALGYTEEAEEIQDIEKKYFSLAVTIRQKYNK